MTSIDEMGPVPTAAVRNGVSDRGLRVFATAARAGTLTRASQQLSIGQPAVSHAIQRLEAALDATLLTRSRTGVSLTPAGELLLEQLEPAFAQIDTAIAHFSEPTGSVVTISVSTSFASWWLLPRLADFKRSHPDISLRLMTADSDLTTDPNDVDLWIPLGRVDRPGLDAVELCREALIPVAAPELAAAITAEKGGLFDAPLLHLEERYQPRYDWSQWFEAHGIPRPLEQLSGDRSNDYSLVVQAALDGQGVALGWEHIVADLLADGRLVALGEPIVTTQPFVILRSSRRPLRPAARAFRSWLVREISG